MLRVVIFFNIKNYLKIHLKKLHTRGLFILQDDIHCQKTKLTSHGA